MERSRNDDKPLLQNEYEDNNDGGSSQYSNHSMRDWEDKEISGNFQHWKVRLYGEDESQSYGSNQFTSNNDEVVYTPQE